MDKSGPRLEFMDEFFDARAEKYYSHMLHHFGEAQKLALYKKICATLRSQGSFVIGDYTAATLAEQQLYMAAKRRGKQQRIPR
ncbi:MAG: hypothetical protein LBT21_00265 [Oscillospiraceae bacterium]|nr:hypothetical protein [Oscillospiraceae bacterium]